MSEPHIAQKAPIEMDMEPGTYFFCACGLAKNKVFCDGSHKGTDILPLKVEITEAKKVWWCGCKHSHNGAFCDGTHNKI
ncbi:MAG: CDGSH iron-sulfur domain-containing protein [Verrucomicrobiota bacterium]|nr:CDGSH iron-sulfur domain-containing protein [Verrucomicrobiota bacterium]